MSNLENLVTKIVADCKSEAQVITENADNEAKKIINQFVEAADLEKESILTKAIDEAKKAKELKISAKKLEIRDKALVEKQKTIDNVIRASISELKNMPENKFTDFVCSYLLNIGISGDEEIILPEKYKGVINNINQRLTEAGQIGALMPNTSRQIDGGFILLKNGVLNNNTFESLVEFYRDELETIVAKNLF